MYIYLCILFHTSTKLLFSRKHFLIYFYIIKKYIFAASPETLWRASPETLWRPPGEARRNTLKTPGLGNMYILWWMYNWRLGMATIGTVLVPMLIKSGGADNTLSCLQWQLGEYQCPVFCCPFFASYVG